MIWNELKERKPLIPKTPAEYTESLRRLIFFLMNHWDEIPDGDGENISPDENYQTKTDMFRIIAGCSNYACDSIKDFNNLIKGVIDV